MHLIFVRTAASRDGACKDLSLTLYDPPAGLPRLVLICIISELFMLASGHLYQTCWWLLPPCSVGGISCGRCSGNCCNDMIASRVCVSSVDLVVVPYWVLVSSVADAARVTSITQWLALRYHRFCAVTPQTAFPINSICWSSLFTIDLSDRSLLFVREKYPQFLLL